MSDEAPEHIAPIRVLLVDDHELVRRGIQMVLRTKSDMLVVGEAGNGVQAIDLARQLQPHVVLLDLMMPGMSGTYASRAIKQVAPLTRVLILSAVDAEHEIVQAMEGSIDGYILKDAPSQELLLAIRTVATGEPYLQGAVTRRLLRRLSAGSGRSEVLVPPQLTPRELDVLRLMATSRSNKEMAELLVVTEETIRSHSKSILTKLQQPNRMQAVLAALRLGLLTLD
ncbi:MAG: response regulator transcription factor [Chloroflexales bacterium]|nr:response regulator transcription factor [Chloroflexales bacterium]